jgi:hypothetical protein
VREKDYIPKKEYRNYTEEEGEKMAHLDGLILKRPGIFIKKKVFMV